jgi:hypothetical protein
MTRGKTMPVTAVLVAAVFVCATATPAAAANSVLLSILLPGLGQAEEGHYGRAAIFSSAAIISWTGVFASEINYSRSVDKYEDEKRIYLAYQDQIDKGKVVRLDDVDATYAAMSEAYDDSDTKEMWRNVFVGALVATYALNLVDVLLSQPESGETEEEPAATSLEVQRDGFRLVRTIRF